MEGHAAPVRISYRRYAARVMRRPWQHWGLYSSIGLAAFLKVHRLAPGTPEYETVFGNVTTLCRIAHKYLLKMADSVSNFPGVVALSRALAGTVTMQLDLDLIFPIRDVPSAELMTLKAVCLWNAGVIDARQRKLVEQRAQQFLEENMCKSFCLTMSSPRSTSSDFGREMLSRAAAVRGLLRRAG